MHRPTDRTVHTTASVTPVMEHWFEQKIVQWVHPEGLIPQSYVSFIQNVEDTDWNYLQRKTYFWPYKIPHLYMIKLLSHFIK